MPRPAVWKARAVRETGSGSSFQRSSGHLLLEPNRLIYEPGVSRFLFRQFRSHETEIGRADVLRVEEIEQQVPDGMKPARARVRVVSSGDDLVLGCPGLTANALHQILNDWATAGQFPGH